MLNHLPACSADRFAEKAVGIGNAGGDPGQFHSPDSFPVGTASPGDDTVAHPYRR
jgi:hypothetical protein